MLRVCASSTGSEYAATVADIFSPLHVDEFQSTFFNKTSVQIQGPAEKFKDLITWDDLNNLLDVAQYPNEDIRLVRNVEYRNCDSLADLRRGLNDGFTLVFNNLHERFKPVSKLAQLIGEFFQEPTQVNLYLSHPGHNGFGLHYDNHDVLVFQIFGGKQWQILPPTVEKPVVVMKKHDSCIPSTNPYLVANLEAGDLLYVPRGHWHLAKPTSSSPSLHLTLGILSRTGLDFLDWLKGELSDDPLWRDSFTFERETQFGSLKKSLSKLLRSRDLFEQFNEYCSLTIGSANHLGLPFCYAEVANSELDEECVYIPPHLTVIKKVQDGGLVLLFNDTRIVLKEAAEQLIDYLLTRQPLDLKNLDASTFNLTNAQVIALLRRLVAAELLHVC